MVTVPVTASASSWALVLDGVSPLHPYIYFTELGLREDTLAEGAGISYMFLGLNHRLTWEERSHVFLQIQSQLAMSLNEWCTPALSVE